MNHSAQVLPNCSNTADGKDGGGVFRGGHYRMSVRVCACACACTPARTRTALTLQTARSAAFSVLM